MHSFIPLWIIGAPFLGLLFLAFAFKGPSAMSSALPRRAPRGHELPTEPSAPLLQPVHPDAPRRLV